MGPHFPATAMFFLIPECNKHQLSNEKNPGWLVYIGGEILPSYIGIIIGHEIRIPIKTNQDDSWKVGLPGFFGPWLNCYLDDQVG